MNDRKLGDPPPHPHEPGGMPLITASTLGAYIERENERLLAEWLARSDAKRRFAGMKRTVTRD